MIMARSLLYYLQKEEKIVKSDGRKEILTKKDKKVKRENFTRMATLIS